MNTNQSLSSNVPESIKTWVHVWSLAPVPLIFLWAVLSALPEAESVSSMLGGLLAIGLIIGYFVFLYYLAGGFDWRQERLSIIRGLLFFVLSGLLYGLLFYGYWYLVRYVMAKVNKLSFSELKGKLLTRESADERLKKT